MLGRATLKKLIDVGATQHYTIRATARNPAKVERLRNIFPEIDIVHVDLEDNVSIHKALQQATKVFVIPGTTQRKEAHIRAIMDSAKKNHVDFVLYLSLLGADQHKTEFARSFWMGEQALSEFDLKYAVLRVNFWADNLLFWRDDIVKNNVLPWPLEDAQVSPVSTCDIASCAVSILTDHKWNQNHVGKHYSITGRETLSGKDIAKAVSRVFGTRIKYQSISLDEFHRDLIERKNFKEPMANAFHDLFAMAQTGRLGVVSRDAYEELGVKPMRLDKWLWCMRDLFVGKVPREQWDWSSLSSMKQYDDERYVPQQQRKSMFSDKYGMKLKSDKYGRGIGLGKRDKDVGWGKRDKGFGGGDMDDVCRNATVLELRILPTSVFLTPSSEGGASKMKWQIASISNLDKERKFTKKSKQFGGSGLDKPYRPSYLVDEDIVGYGGYKTKKVDKYGSGLDIGKYGKRDKYAGGSGLDKPYRPSYQAIDENIGYGGRKKSMMSRDEWPQQHPVGLADVSRQYGQRRAYY
jgi:NAD(P)H dehydrogenase (quinone)